MKTLISCMAGLLAASFLSAQPLLDDSFTYPDGPLAGNGGWARGPNTPTSDNPSDYIVVESGAVKFDWTTTDPINNLVRYLWDSTLAVTGTVYAIFDLKVTTAPQAAADVRPGFFAFGNADGNQQRGFVGIRGGSTPGTFNLGVSPNSQDGVTYTFDTEDLALDTVYQVMVSFDTTVSRVRLWINTTDPLDSARLTAVIGTSSGSIRRVNLRMYNSDGAGGTTNLGVFYVDNFLVPEVPKAYLPYEDAFDYVDGPLSGQGQWARGSSDPTSDNPSDYIIVESGAVKYDWTTTDPINNAVRVQWEDEQLTSGWIYAAFDLKVTQAPDEVPGTGVAPGFFCFDRSGGGQLRGHVGIKAGDQAGTFQLGISPSSQWIQNYTFAAQDLDVGSVYRVMVGYEIATAQTKLWIGSDDPNTAPAASATGSPSLGVRRIQLRMYNTDGQVPAGTTNLGVFHLDNLFVQHIALLVLPALQIAPVTGGLRIEWDQQAGRTAQLEYNADLGATWTPIGAPFITTATPGSFDYTDTTWDGLAPRFYRLDIE